MSCFNLPFPAWARIWKSTRAGRCFWWRRPRQGAGRARQGAPARSHREGRRNGGRLCHQRRRERMAQKVLQQALQRISIHNTGVSLYQAEQDVSGWLQIVAAADGGHCCRGRRSCRWIISASGVWRVRNRPRARWADVCPRRCQPPWLSRRSARGAVQRCGVPEQRHHSESRAGAIHARSMGIGRACPRGAIRFTGRTNGHGGLQVVSRFRFSHFPSPSLVPTLLAVVGPFAAIFSPAGIVSRTDSNPSIFDSFIVG